MEGDKRRLCVSDMCVACDALGTRTAVKDNTVQIGSWRGGSDLRRPRDSMGRTVCSARDFNLGWVDQAELSSSVCSA